MNSTPIRIAILLILLSSCRSLPNRAPTKIKLLVEKNQSLQPGDQFKYGVEFFFGAKKKKSLGLAGGTVAWKNIYTEVRGGKFEVGKITISKDPRDNPDYKLHIKTCSDKFRTKCDSVSFDLDHSGTFYANFDGKNGKRGADGKRGKNGRDGANNMVHNGVGFNGEHGKTGKNGLAGKNGANGPSLSVYISGDEEKSLLKVKVTDQTTQKTKGRYNLSLNRSSLTVSGSGGNGGNGGDGGNGGKGGNGGQGRARGGNGGNGGKGGNAGPGGDGGNAGKIIVFVGEEWKKYLPMIRFESETGEMGKGALGGSAGSKGFSGRSGFNGKEGVAGESAADGKNGKRGKDVEIVLQEVDLDW